MYYKNRLWRTEVNTKKRERTRQQAAEMKEMQKFLLIKVKFDNQSKHSRKQTQPRQGRYD